MVNLIALGLLGGAVAKSAQIPLHTWLPDAMEGPTPVSALIHAATMVTAARCTSSFARVRSSRRPRRQHLAAILGAVTLSSPASLHSCSGTSSASSRYSTMSQIGYMFLAAGIGAYGYAIFHLMTHAFFKALLFMSAGLRHPPPRRRAGHPQGWAGCKNVMPRTHIAFLAGALARRDPDLRGFWSKDGIVAARFASTTRSACSCTQLG
jgi:NADH-quinone oxidoreductase subunit L